jgi:hypothetical protein
MEQERLPATNHEQQFTELKAAKKAKEEAEHAEKECKAQKEVGRESLQSAGGS